jgi:hypothetical protein
VYNSEEIVRKWPCHDLNSRSLSLYRECAGRHPASSCETYGGRSGNGTEMYPSISVSPVNTIPPMLYTHYHVITILTRWSYRYGVEIQASKQGQVQIFHTRPDTPCDPLILLCKRYWIFHGDKEAGVRL